MKQFKNVILLVIAAASFAIILSRDGFSIANFVRFVVSASAVAAFGLLMIWMLKRGTKQRLASLAVPDGNRPLEVIAKLDAAAGTRDSISACINAIRCLPNVAESKIEQPADDRLTVRTNCTMHSWGEKLTVRVGAIQDGSVIELRSVPISSWVTGDRDMNFQNVYLVVRELKASLGARVFYSNTDL